MRTSAIFTAALAGTASAWSWGGKAKDLKERSDALPSILPAGLTGPASYPYKTGGTGTGGILPTGSGGSLPSGSVSYTKRPHSTGGVLPPTGGSKGTGTGVVPPKHTGTGVLPPGTSGTGHVGTGTGGSGGSSPTTAAPSTVTITSDVSSTITKTIVGSTTITSTISESHTIPKCSIININSRLQLISSPTRLPSAQPEQKPTTPPL